MHPLDKAERIIRGEWPKNPHWIYESPDGGRTVYRRMSRFKPRQLLRKDGELVDNIEKLDDEYFTEYLGNTHD